MDKKLFVVVLDPTLTSCVSIVLTLFTYILFTYFLGFDVPTSFIFIENVFVLFFYLAHTWFNAYRLVSFVAADFQLDNKTLIGLFFSLSA